MGRVDIGVMAGCETRFGKLPVLIVLEMPFHCGS